MLFMKFYIFNATWIFEFLNVHVFKYFIHQLNFTIFNYYFHIFIKGQIVNIIFNYYIDKLTIEK